MELFTGFLIGFLGSLHCIAMCGPIAMALPGNSMRNWSFISRKMVYNSGRIITYSILGLVFGLLGDRIMIGGLQQTISIILGILILISFTIPYNVRNRLLNKLGIYFVFNKIKGTLAKLFRNNNKSSLLLIGVLNGLLPCGFVYIGIAGAIAIGSPVKSMLFMTMFGIGTLPMMLGVSIAGNVFKSKLRGIIPKLVPAFALVLAFVLILRGLNLGIPYVSPKIETRSEVQQELICH